MIHKHFWLFSSSTVAHSYVTHSYTLTCHFQVTLVQTEPDRFTFIFLALSRCCHTSRSYIQNSTYINFSHVKWTYIISEVGRFKSCSEQCFIARICLTSLIYLSILHTYTHIHTFWIEW